MCYQPCAHLQGSRRIIHVIDMCRYGYFRRLTRIYDHLHRIPGHFFCCAKPIIDLNLEPVHLLQNIGFHDVRGILGVPVVDHRAGDIQARMVQSRAIVFVAN